MNKARLLLVALLTIFWLQGCGFKLKGDQALPMGIEQVAISGGASHSPLKRALELRLKQYQIPQVPAETLTEDSPAIHIQLLPDTLERRLLSLFTTGQVAEYELVLSLRYEVLFPDQEPLFVEFDVTREYQDDPDAVLAKSRELELILSELRLEAADRIIRLLASQYATQSQV